MLDVTVGQHSLCIFIYIVAGVGLYIVYAIVSNSACYLGSVRNV